MNKIFFLSVVAVVIISGCAGTPSILKEEAAKKILEAAESLNSYKVDADNKLGMDIAFLGQKQSASISLSLKGVVDKAEKKMYLDMEILSQGKSINTTMYVIDGTAYIKSGETWFEQALPESVWKSQNQYDSGIELLEDSEIEILSDEMVNNKQNYVVKVTPDLAKLLEKSFGSLSGAQAPQLQSANLSKAIKSFFVKYWVQKDTFYISKYSIVMLIDFTDEKTKASLKMDMNLETRIYDHNMPVSIELPEEAKNAQEILPSEGIAQIAAKAKAGEECTFSSDCATDKCVNKVCTEGKVGDACFSRFDCQESLKCTGGKCAEKASAGESCNWSDDCKSMSCVNDVCVEGAGVGEPCTTSSDCKTACYNFSGGGRLCEPLPCINNKCSEKLDNGELCSFSSECKSYVCVNSRCSETRGSLGDKCTSSTDCKAELTCKTGVCNEKADIGEACMWGPDCKSDICINDKCSAGAAGNECRFGSDCKSRICVDNICRDGNAGDPCRSSFDCKSYKCENNVCAE